MASRQAAADWLAKATPEHAAPVIVRRWDDSEWEQVWRLYIATLADHSDRRQLLHDVATISFLPVADQFPSHCNIIRLKWAGYDGNGRCDAEEEIIDWAAEVVRQGDNDAIIYRIVCTLMGWERALEDPLTAALQSLCESSPSADTRKAAMKALIAKSPAEPLPMPDDDSHVPATSPEPGPAGAGSRKKTQKIMIPQLSADFDAKNPKPTYDRAPRESDSAE